MEARGDLNLRLHGGVAEEKRLHLVLDLLRLGKLIELTVLGLLAGLHQLLRLNEATKSRHREERREEN